jgi:hypothetical protein
MTPLQINIQDLKDDKPAWPDMKEAVEGRITRCGILQGGMSSGLPSFAFIIETDDGDGHVMAQLSYNHFEGIYRACQGAMQRCEEEGV